MEGMDTVNRKCLQGQCKAEMKRFRNIRCKAERKCDGFKTAKRTVKTNQNITGD